MRLSKRKSTNIIATASAGRLPSQRQSIQSPQDVKPRYPPEAENVEEEEKSEKMPAAESRSREAQRSRRRDILKKLLVLGAVRTHLGRYQVDSPTKQQENLKTQRLSSKDGGGFQQYDVKENVSHTSRSPLKTKDNKLFYMTIEPTRHLDADLIVIQEKLSNLFRPLAKPCSPANRRQIYESGGSRDSSIEPYSFSLQMNQQKPYQSISRRQSGLNMNNNNNNINNINNGVDFDLTPRTSQRKSLAVRKTQLINQTSSRPRFSQNNQRISQNVTQSIKELEEEYELEMMKTEPLAVIDQNNPQFIAPALQRMRSQPQFKCKSYKRIINYSAIKPKLNTLQECSFVTKPDYLTQRCLGVIQDFLLEKLTDFYAALQDLRETAGRFEKVNPQGINKQILYVNRLFQETNKLIHEIKEFLTATINKYQEEEHRLENTNHKKVNKFSRLIFNTYKQNRSGASLDKQYSSRGSTFNCSQLGEETQDLNFAFRATSEAEAFRFNYRQFHTLSLEAAAAVDQYKLIQNIIELPVNQDEGYRLIQQMMKVRFNANQIVQQVRYMEFMHPNQNSTLPKMGSGKWGGCGFSNLDRSGKKLCSLEIMRKILRNRKGNALEEVHKQRLKPSKCKTSASPQ